MTCVDAFSEISPELTALMERQQRARRRRCSLWNKQCTRDIFNGKVSCCRQQRGWDAHACMNFLCFYTSSVHSYLSTGGIIYKLVLHLNSGKRKAPYCREYISKYEESPETGHFMDQQEPRILKWVESCSAAVCTPSSSASEQGRNGPRCTSSLSGSF